MDRPLSFAVIAMAALRRITPLLVLTLLLAHAYSSLAQQQLGKVIGQVLLDKGDFPPHPMMVELDFRGSATQTVYTDAQGRFGFYGLSADVYHVVMHEDGYQSIDEEANVDPFSSPIVVVKIRLVASTAKKVDQGGVKGSNPYVIDLSEYKRHFPKPAIKEFDSGVKADKAHKPDEAIRHYEKAISLAPDFYPARNNLGSDYLSKADFANAQKQFEEAIHLNKDDSQAYFNLGNVLTLTNHVPEAETVINEGLQKRPDSAFGYFLLGSLHARSGRTSEAEKNLRHAIQLDPAMPEVYLQLVNLYLQQNRKTEAIAELQDFLHAFPDGAFSPKAKQVLKKLQSQQADVSRQLLGRRD